jgi:E3 ubiquitin-protein ligase NEDD4
MSGFSELIPQELINVFDERELEVMLTSLLVCASISHFVTFDIAPHWWHVRYRCVCLSLPQLSDDQLTLNVRSFSDDWTKFTDYRGYEMNDEVIQWFWQVIRSWPTERKSRLLQFATGTSRIPVNGFKDLQGSDGPRRFTIEKSGDPGQLPKSHTCFNRVRLS